MAGRFRNGCNPRGRYQIRGGCGRGAASLVNIPLWKEHSNASKHADCCDWWRAGGRHAATRARHLGGCGIILLEQGPHISYANCGLPYHIGGDCRTRRLVATPGCWRYRIDVRTRTEAVAIDRERREVARNVASGAEERIPYDKLILSPGAEPVRPPIPGSDSPRVRTLRSLADMDAILATMTEGKVDRALVIGGGFIGLELTEALRERGIGVTLVELAPQVMAPLDPEMAAPLHQTLRMHGVDLRLETSVTRFTETDGCAPI